MTVWKTGEFSNYDGIPRKGIYRDAKRIREIAMAWQPEFQWISYYRISLLFASSLKTKFQVLRARHHLEQLNKTKRKRKKSWESSVWRKKNERRLFEMWHIGQTYVVYGNTRAREPENLILNERDLTSFRSAPLNHSLWNVDRTWMSFLRHFNSFVFGVMYKTWSMILLILLFNRIWHSPSCEKT